MLRAIAEGDRLLVLLAQTLESAVDSRDTVARVGGDELAIVASSTLRGGASPHV